MEAMRASKSRKHAKEKADKYFSEYIRRRAADYRGLARCVTCGCWRHWKKMDAGHFISRDREATRYDTRNAHAQCQSCNRFRSGRQFEHGKKIDEMYGEGTAEELNVKSKMPCRRKQSDYEYIAADFKAKIDRMTSSIKS